MSHKKVCVLAAVSLSSELESIVARARQLAQGMNLPLVFLHVVNDTSLFNYGNNFSLSGLVTGEYKEDEINKMLMARQMIEARLKLSPTQHESLEVHTGSCARTIEMLARKQQAAIIVLGQPEASFGSIIMHVARHAPCDIHIVRIGNSN